MARATTRSLVPGLLAFVLLAPAFLPCVAAADDRPLTQVFRPPFPIVNADLNVTVILAGINLSASERADLPARVNHTWLPIITSLAVPIGVNYTVRLRIIDAPSNFTESYAAALQASFSKYNLGRFVGNYVGLFENLSAAFPSYTNLTPVRHADANDAAAWLATADQDFPEIAAPAGEARLFFLNPYPIAVPYYYAVNTTDRDRNTNLTYETLKAWGDAGGAFFQDLRANPSQLGSGSGSGIAADFRGAPPLWSYGPSTGERARLVADLGRYIDHSVRILIGPSYVVTPFYPISVTYNVTLFDNTAAQTLFDASGIGGPHGINRTQDIVNPGLVEAAVHDLIPFAPVSVRVRAADAASDPDVRASLQAHTADTGSSQVVNPFGVNADLKGRWGVPNLPVAAGDAVTIPVLMVVFDGDAWVDDIGVRGATLQRNDGRAAAIVIAAGLQQLEARGFSETLVHEAGHSLGLGHPHELGRLDINGTVVTEVDWLRTESSTPMTYLPAYADYSFDSFDRHALWYGIAAGTLAAAYEVRRNAYDRLEGRGYNLSTLPLSITSNETLFSTYANTTASLLTEGLLFLDASPPYSSGGAIVMAKRAFDEAKLLLLLAYSQPFCCLDGGRTFLPAFSAPEAALALALVVAVAVWAPRRRDS